jgi:hypothetical protein
MTNLSEREFGVTLSDEAKREAPVRTVRTELHPTRSFYLEVISNSQMVLNFAPFGTDNDFNRPSGTGLFPHDSGHFVPGYSQPVPPGKKPFSHRSAAQ